MTRETNAAMPEMAEGRTWNTVVVHEWMWATEGLGLGHGADLFVYAALFAVTDAGALTYRAPCAALAATIGYARETVQRSLTHLCSLNLIWSPDPRTSSGGTPRTYAISPGPLARARGEQCHVASEASSNQNGTGTRDCGIIGSMPHGRCALSTLDVARSANAPASKAMAMIVENPAIARNPSPTSASSVTVGCDTPAPMTDEGDGPSPVVAPCRDAASHALCDASSRPLARHTPENPTSPAAIQLCECAPISSYLPSSDMLDTSGESCLDKGGTRSLTRVEFAAFETLVGSSLLPVDDAFLERNLDAFKEIVASGVPADAILEAYEDYAAYQSNRYRQSGTWRPMHLLHWLRANPNGNIDFVMRKREIAARRTSSMTSRTRVRTNPVTTHATKQCTPRRGPRLTLCRDRGRALWFVDDDHGSRRVEGAEGIEDLGEATCIYERMYERECLTMRKAA